MHPRISTLPKRALVLNYIGRHHSKRFGVVTYTHQSKARLTARIFGDSKTPVIRVTPQVYLV